MECPRTCRPAYRPKAGRRTGRPADRLQKIVSQNPQPRHALVLGRAGDDGGVDRTDGNARHPVGADAGLMQALVHPGLVGPQAPPPCSTRATVDCAPPEFAAARPGLSASAEAVLDVRRGLSVSAGAAWRLRDGRAVLMRDSSRLGLVRSLRRGHAGAERIFREHLGDGFSTLCCDAAISGLRTSPTATPSHTSCLRRASTRSMFSVPSCIDRRYRPSHSRASRHRSRCDSRNKDRWPAAPG